MAIAGKTVIITGASRGIGRRLAVAAAERGANVALAARSVEPRKTLPGTLGETLEAIEALGGRAIAVACDVTKRTDLERLVQSTIDEFGRLDAVVNNAADMAGGDLDDVLTAMLDGSSPVAGEEQDPLRLSGWLRQFATNVHAPYILTMLAVPHMKDVGGGVIVNLSSAVADLVAVDEDGGITAPPNPGALGYATTKAALNRLTNAAAIELAPHGIAVIAVDPGTTRTEAVEVLAAQGWVDADSWGSIDVPVTTIVDILDSDEPLARTGVVVRARLGSVE